jgi:ABC-2 type transport system ATP-binding protein
VLVRSPRAAPLGEALVRAGAQVRDVGPGVLEIRGLTTEQVGHLAFQNGVELHELSAQRSDLEELFFALTAGAGPGGEPAWVG